MSASGTERRARSASISLRVNEDEKRGIKARANAHGLSVGAFMRATALEKPLPRVTRFSREEAQFIALILATVATLMDEVKRLEDEQRKLRMTQQLLFVRDHCFSKLGRKA